MRVMVHPAAALRTRAARHLAAIGISAALLVATVAPTLASGDRAAPNTFVQGYGASVGAFVACDADTGTMTVSASATTMQPQGMYGPTAGPYDGGQFVRYNVLAREVGTSAWTTVYSWSDWQWIVSIVGSTANVGDAYFVVPQDLGTNVVTGTAGHGYELLVQVDYWTGLENIVNVAPTYSQALTAGPFGTVYLTPGYCHL